jgi:C-5 cytosine-specific DNA methylase
MTRPAFLSAFAGYGGLDLALEYHGWRCAAQVENDPYCTAILAEHWPAVPRWGDIREVDWNDVIARTGPVDLVVAGFPCQPTSQAGRRKAQADPRWLWPEVTLTGGSNSRRTAIRRGSYISGSLNPDWVEQLMGLPQGWTATAGPPPRARRSTRGSRPAPSPPASPTGASE